MTHHPLQSLAQAAETHYDELKQFVRKRTGSSAIAEEVVQETWIRANAVTAELPDNPRAYLYRMASNLVVDHIRREQSRAPEIETDAQSPFEQTASLEAIPCPAPSPLDTAISRQELSALDVAVRELPEKCRDVFLLYRGHGMSMREVAIHMGITQKTVEKHIAKAMIHCRKRLREVGRDV